MDWITKMNDAVGYMEAHLDDEISLNKAGRRAGCSAYHFARVFSYMAGITPGEYIRRRRLTRAAFDLQQTGDKVIDVALRYGYDSPTSFTRAFTALHGMPPSAARETGRSFVAYPPLSFQITIKGVTAMNYRIEEKDAFRVVGVRLDVSSDIDEGFAAIPPFWAQSQQNGNLMKVAQLIHKEPYAVLGLSTGNWQGGNHYSYYIAAATDNPTPAGMEEYTVPATWAIFECIGPMPGAVQETQKRILTEWLPTSGYNYADAPDIELYPDGDQSAPDYKCWVWLPVVKK